MGLESYLLYVRFKTPPNENGAIVMLADVGMSYLRERSKYQTEESYGDHFFEQRTAKGLIEANLVTATGDPSADEFSLRFSVLSPMSIIEQTFDLLIKLNCLNPIEVYDTEVKNHIMRQLRQSGRVDKNFEGLNEEDEEAIDKLCIISLDAADFKRNELQIMKRETVLSNTQGVIIEGGNATINYIENKGVFERFLGWIRKEL